MAEMLRQPGSEDLGLPFGPNSGRRWYTLAKGRAGIRAPGARSQEYLLANPLLP